MHTHFDRNLNLRGIILEHRPKVIVECGAGNGDCTRLLAHLKSWYPFDLHVISDKKIEDIQPAPEWHVGLSYNVLKEFPDNSIGLCIIDTDHNFWTLQQELAAVKDKMVEGGLIVFHDVDEFYHNTGMAMSYWNDEPYPSEEIKKCVPYGGVGDALLKFLVDHNAEYKLTHWTTASYGAAVIEKKTITQTTVVMPAGAPLFAKPYVPEATNT